MDIRKFLKRKTTSSDDSVCSKITEKILQNKDEENINVSANSNNKGVEEGGISNDIFYLLDEKLSDNYKFECIRHRVPDNSFNYPAKQYEDSEDSRTNSGLMNPSYHRDCHD